MAFGRECMLCMRCVYICPRQAIKTRRLRGSVVDPYHGGPKLQNFLSEKAHSFR
ncbi:4Fe-4S binding protein [Paenibacillus donghaensis]|uniref:4Fe-4S binding protein n=1 Tax=Paenibacillus donghaensis TaxID=414771 RepID=UPI003CCC1AD2